MRQVRRDWRPCPAAHTHWCRERERQTAWPKRGGWSNRKTLPQSWRNVSLHDGPFSISLSVCLTDVYQHFQLKFTKYDDTVYQNCSMLLDFSTHEMWHTLDRWLIYSAVLFLAEVASQHEKSTLHCNPLAPWTQLPVPFHVWPQPRDLTASWPGVFTRLAAAVSGCWFFWEQRL